MSAFNLRPFDHSGVGGGKGVVLEHEDGDFPGVWITDSEIQIDEQFVRTRQRSEVVEWLRAAADAIEQATTQSATRSNDTSRSAS